jgi:hypothetical protein
MVAILKKYLVHVLAYIILMLVSFVYFSPTSFGDKVLQQSDNVMARGMQAEMRVYQNPETGDYPLWTNSMFSGMPGYQILYHTDNPLKAPFTGFLWGNPMWPPHTAILLLMAGFYFLFITLKVDWRIALIGAVAFGFGANFMDNVVAGHSTKIIALAYMAPIFASVILTCRGKYLLGGALTAFFLGLQLLANHLQITYYTLILVGILGLLFLIRSWQRKEMTRAWIAAGVTVVAIMVGTATNIGRLWTTYEYSQESIRGKSELTVKSENSYGTRAGEGGLSKSYVFGWSFGILETYTLLIPDFMGGTSNENFVSDRTSNTYQALGTLQSQEEINQMLPALSHYWGDQPGVGSPVYFGAVIFFFFFLGIFLVKGTLRNWLLVGAILTLLMSWGDNFAIFNNLLYDYFPMYNKFRAVTMVLGPCFAMVLLLAILGLQAFVSKDIALAEKKKALQMAGYISGGLVVLGLLLSFLLNYNTGAFPTAIAEALQADRAALLRADAMRSLLFIALTFGIGWLYLRKTIPSLVAILGIGALVAIDMFGVALRTLNQDSFVEDRASAAITAPAEVDNQINSDPDPHYRVADFRRNPFANALTSYHHKSVGGYHAAKLMRYQEIIEGYLGNPVTGQQLYNMLNTKYFIGQQGQPQRNGEALGNAWFVEEIQTVPDGDAEFQGTGRPGSGARCAGPGKICRRSAEFQYPA